MKIKYIIILFGILLFVVSCSTQEQAQQPINKENDQIGQQQQEPSDIIPSDQESDAFDQPVEPKKEEMTAEVKELFSKADTKIKSLSYRYKGPETADLIYGFFVKEDKIKIIPDRGFKSVSLPEDYDTIFLDLSQETAASYCIDRQCAVKGKKEDLSFDEEYILTPLDWLNKVTEAKKIGEEMMQKREVWKVETNAGIMWIDTYYGVPLEVDLDGERFIFDLMAFNTVSEEEVTPPSS